MPTVAELVVEGLARPVSGGYRLEPAGELRIREAIDRNVARMAADPALRRRVESWAVTGSTS